MMMNCKEIVFTTLAVCALFKGYSQTSHVINVKANEIVAEVQPTMWGIFFEDINLGADGGIYAELVKNRSFEFFVPLMGWKVNQQPFREGAVLVMNREAGNTANPRFIRVNYAGTETLGLTNEGFRGMGIKKGIRYDFSLMYRQSSAGVKLRIELVNSSGDIIGKASLSPQATGSGWNKANVSFNATDTAWKGKMNIWFEGAGVIDLDMISLFPEDTWKKRPGGMRADMIQMLADMKPGFIRFPGGCIVEGRELETRYQWKKTLGPVEERQLIVNRWNTEFSHRPTPDYFQTFGLGFYEYFQLAEDIGAAPLPILNCGMACQFNTAELVPLDQLGPYVQDALDLIEFANADTTTQWGKVRAQMGHPQPFNLKMMGIGNENWGPQYLERLQIFTKAIKEKYPDFKLVNSSGTDPDGERFDLLNGELRKASADIIDEHYYRTPDWFLKNAGRYDSYPRNGSKVFAGEYAAQSDKTVSINNKNNWKTAIAEAAFMTGLERNAQVVNLASYAPLFAHVDGWQWTPDLIWVNNMESYGTPNYYVQQLYSVNKGTNVIPALTDGKPLTGADSVYASAVIDKNSGEVIIKVVNASGSVVKRTIAVEGKKKLSSKVSVTSLTGSLQEVNSFTAPRSIAPVTTLVPLKGNRVEISMAPNSFNVYKIGLK